jgi:putative sterol carrier protein
VLKKTNEEILEKMKNDERIALELSESIKEGNLFIMELQNEVADKNKVNLNFFIKLILHFSSKMILF